MTQNNVALNVKKMFAIKIDVKYNAIHSLKKNTFGNQWKKTHYLKTRIRKKSENDFVTFIIHETTNSKTRFRVRLNLHTTSIPKLRKKFCF